MEMFAFPLCFIPYVFFSTLLIIYLYVVNVKNYRKLNVRHRAVSRDLLRLGFTPAQCEKLQHKIISGEGLYEGVQDISPATRKNRYPKEIS